MKVIEIHGTIAIVDSTENLVKSGAQFIEIDESDSRCVIKNRPEYQKSLQNIFADVMAIFGFRLRNPNVEVVEKVNAA